MRICNRVGERKVDYEENEKTVVSVYDGSAVPGFISGVQYKKSRTVGWGDGRSCRMKKAEEKKRIR